MKKLYLAGLAFGVVAMTAVAASALEPTALPGEGIKGSLHDLSFNSTYTSAKEGAGLNRICVYCHAPHHTYTTAEVASSYVPLWNRPTPVTIYDMYSNGSNPNETLWTAGLDGIYGTADDVIDATVKVNHNSYAAENAASLAPGDVSMLCLSCHDGTVAVNTYGRIPQDADSRNVGTTMIADQYKIGGEDALTGLGDLSNHHPIGFDYASVVAVDDEIADTNVLMGQSGYTIGDLLSGTGTMECNTCHDVHNTKNQGAKFIWIEDNQSAFCLTCHLK